MMEHPASSASATTKRSKISCYPCRTRKSKCDQARPCSSCVLRDTAHQCSDSSPGSTLTSTAIANKPTRPKRKHVEVASASNSPDHSAFSQPSAIRSVRQHSPNLSVGQEIAQLKDGLSRLESLLSSRSPIPDTEGAYDVDDIDEGHEYGPSTARSRQRWSQLRSLLPPMIDTHVMFHYAFVEADWLLNFFDYRRFIRRWGISYDNQAISDVLAVQVMALTACAAVFLADNSNRVLQSAVPIRTMHTRLIKDAIRILEAIPQSAPTEAARLDLIECYIFISLYFRCISPDAKMARFVESALALIVDFGLNNELHPSWLDLSQYQIERRRIIVNVACVSAKWLSFHSRFVPILDTIRAFQVGQPSFLHFSDVPPLDDWPDSVDIAARFAHADTPISVRWHPKTPDHIQGVRRFHQFANRQADILPRISVLIAQVESKLINEANTGLTTKHEYKELAKQTRDCLDTLVLWRTKLLPDALFGEAQIVHAFRTSSFRQDPKRVALVLMLNHTIYYMTAALLRPWVLLSDRANRLRDHFSDKDYDPPQMNEGFFSMLNQRTNEHVQLAQAAWLPASFWTEMELKSIETAQQSISTIPLIRAMQADPASQFYVGWIAPSLYEAALNLAVPLLGYHRRQALLPSGHHETKWKLTSSPTDLGHDIVAVLEALAQLSNNAMAKSTGDLLQKVMKAANVSYKIGVRFPNPSSSTSKIDDEEWVFSAPLPHVKQSATDGLALLAAASDNSSHSTNVSPPDATILDKSNYEALATSQAEAEVADAHFLDELLKLDPSYWEGVLNERSVPS